MPISTFGDGDGMNELTRKLLDAGFASLFDANPVIFTQGSEKGVVPVRQVLSRPSGLRHSLRRPLARNAFLCGCLDATEQAATEHLIVGFGKRRGATTCIADIHHELGNATNVHCPATLSSEMKRFLAADLRNEVIVFHNHPSNLLNILVNNAPLASCRDRDSLLKMRYLESDVARRALLGHGNIRFFLGENGLVREFRTPVLRDVAERLRVRQGGR
jgi:hypothetical protein